MHGTDKLLHSSGVRGFLRSHKAGRTKCITAMGVGSRTKLYACAQLIIDGLGHTTWSSMMPVSRSRTALFYRNRHIIFLALVALEPLVSLMSRFGACSARIRGDRQTHTQTHRASTVTLAAHAHRGLIIRLSLTLKYVPFLFYFNLNTSGFLSQHPGNLFFFMWEVLKRKDVLSRKGREML